MNSSLQVIAGLYARIPTMRSTLGKGEPSAERTLEEVASLIVTSEGSEGYPRWCHGNGEPHCWLDEPVGDSFSKPCSAHAAVSYFLRLAPGEQPEDVKAFICAVPVPHSESVPPHMEPSRDFLFRCNREPDHLGLHWCKEMGLGWGGAEQYRQTVGHHPNE